MTRFLLLITFLISSSIYGQVALFDWAKGLNSTSENKGQSITTDYDGNVYITGYFKGTVDFDPGVLVDSHTAVGGADIYVQKLDSAGNHIWVRTFGSIGSDAGLGINVDTTYGVFITGDFSNTVDFNPSSNVENKTANNGRDVFLLNLDTAGNFLWVGSFGGNGNDGGRRVHIDNNNDIIISGWFTGTTDFDIGSGTSSLSSSGSLDGFIAKYSNSGNFIWARKIGGSGFDTGFGLGTDNSNDVFLTGVFEGTVDFNPGTGIYSLSSNGNRDAYVLKLTSTGNFLWARKIGGSTDDSGNFLDVDNSGNVYIHGQFGGTVDFNPGTGILNKTAVGGKDAYLLKLSSLGSFEWVVPFGGTSEDLGQGLKVDGQGNSYITGFFQGTVDFNPSTQTNQLVSSGGKDIYIAKYNSFGVYQWAQKMGGAGNNTGKAIEFDRFGYVVETGWYNQTADFNSGAGVYNLTTGGGENSFITRFRVCYPTYQSITAYTCGGYVSPSGNFIWDSTGVYTDVIPNSAGCDSVITINLVNQTTFGADTLVSCGSYTSPSGQFVWDSTGVYQDTIVNQAGCDSILTIDLMIPLSSPTNLVVNSCYFYISPSGNQTWTSSGLYADTLVSVYGCDSILQIDLSINNSFTSQVISSCGPYVTPSGSVITSSMVVNDTLINSLGCDSVISMDITIHSPQYFATNVATCGTYTWSVNNQTYNGNVTDSVFFTNAMGCDSVHILNLTIGQGVIMDTMQVLSCGPFTSPSGNFVWNSSGTYYDTIVMSMSCDTVKVVNLVVGNNTFSNVSVVSCGPYESSSGITYPNSGVFSDTLVNAQGCDSIVSLTVTVYPEYVNSISITACDSFQSPSGQEWWTLSGVYSDTLSSQLGCDSIVIVNLTIGNSFSTISESSCGAYTSPSGKYFTSSGIYSDTISNSVGCDSVITINLNVIQLDTTLIQSGDSLIAVNAPNVNYQWYHCDSTDLLIAGASQSYFVPLVSGFYRVGLNNGVCNFKSTCVEVRNVGTEEELVPGLRIWPNPTKGHMFISANEDKIKQIVLLDLKGQVVSNQMVNSSIWRLDVDGFNSGIYILRVFMNNKWSVHKIVLQ